MLYAHKTREELNIRVLEQDGLQWVDIVHPTRAEMEWLRENYDFHPLALDDCLSRIQIPKLDDYDAYLFLVLHFPMFDRRARITLPEEVDIFVGPRYVVTVHSSRIAPLVSLFQECEADEETRAGVMRQGGGYLLYRILDVIVDYSFPILNKVIERVDDVEVRIFDERSAALVREISVIRRDIISFRRIVRPQVETFELLEQRQYPILKVNPDVYFGDLADHIRRIWTELEELKEVIEGLHDSYSSLINHQVNQIIRVLTIISTIMLPMSVISGIYGMNLDLPLQGTPFAFAVILGVMAIIVIGMLWIFRLHRWL